MAKISLEGNGLCIEVEKCPHKEGWHGERFVLTLPNGKRFQVADWPDSGLWIGSVCESDDDEAVMLSFPTPHGVVLKLDRRED